MQLSTAHRTKGRAVAHQSTEPATNSSHPAETDRLAQVYLANYRSLLALARLLLDEPAACEDVVQEAYVRIAAAPARLRDSSAAAAYLRTTVLNLCRSSLRRRLVAVRHAPAVHRKDLAIDIASSATDRVAVLAAMRTLPMRQREVIALRYYADLSEADTAELLGIALGSVKSHAHRGLTALARALEVTS